MTLEILDDEQFLRGDLATDHDELTDLIISDPKRWKLFINISQR